MACFVAPMVEAIVVTVIKKTVQKKEEKNEVKEISTPSWSRKLGWLNKLLWGGVSLLALEHLWHGELVPWPPFLTAVSTPGEVGPMLHEIATTGVAMAITVTFAWVLMVVFSDYKAKAGAAKTQIES